MRDGKPLIGEDGKVLKSAQYGPLDYLIAALSHACHYHPYELAPTAAELTGWLHQAAEIVTQMQASATAPGSRLSGRFLRSRRLDDWTADLTPGGPGCRGRASRWRRAGGERLACGGP